MKNFIQEGDILTVLAPANVLSGAGVQVGSIFGIAVYDALSGAEVEIKTEGVFDVPKVSAQAWTQGVRVYWDNTAKNFTTTASTNALVGVAVLAAANPSATGRVLLTGAYTI